MRLLALAALLLPVWGAAAPLRSTAAPRSRPQGRSVPVVSLGALPVDASREASVPLEEARAPESAPSLDAARPVEEAAPRREGPVFAAVDQARSIAPAGPKPGRDSAVAADAAYDGRLVSERSGDDVVIRYRPGSGPRLARPEFGRRRRETRGDIPEYRAVRMGKSVLGQASQGGLIMSGIASLLFLGPIGLAIAGLAAWAARRDHRSEDAAFDRHLRRLDGPNADAFQRRVEGRLDALLLDLGWPAQERPRVIVIGGKYDENMVAWGLGINHQSTIYAGMAFAARGDEEIDAVLAHELAHLHYRDGDAGLLEGGEFVIELGKRLGLAAVASGLAAAVGLVLLGPAPGAWAAIHGLAGAMSASGVLLPLAAAGAAAVPLVLAVVAAASAAGVSRLNERRADSFAAWLRSGRGLSAALTWLNRDRREPTLPTIFGTHPLTRVRLRRLAAFPKG